MTVCLDLRRIQPTAQISTGSFRSTSSTWEPRTRPPAALRRTGEDEGTRQDLYTGSVTWGISTSCAEGKAAPADDDRLTRAAPNKVNMRCSRCWGLNSAPQDLDWKLTSDWKTHSERGGTTCQGSCINIPQTLHQQPPGGVFKQKSKPEASWWDTRSSCMCLMFPITDVVKTSWTGSLNYEEARLSSLLQVVASAFRTGGVKVPGSPPGTFLTVSAENVTLIMRMRSHRITAKYLIRFYRLIKIQKIKVFCMTFPPLWNQESLFCDNTCSYTTSNSQFQINEL